MCGRGKGVDPESNVCVLGGVLTVRLLHSLQEVGIDIMQIPVAIEGARGGKELFKGGTQCVGHFLPRRYFRYGTARSISGKNTDFLVMGK